MMRNSRTPQSRAASVDEAWRSLAAIVPGWPAPPGVRAFVTGRAGGVSVGPWGLDGERPGGLNLGVRCGDDPRAVAVNRARLAAVLPSAPHWLEQVHGTAVHVARVPGAQSVAACAPERAALRAHPSPEPRADAAITDQPRVVVAVLTADCLPVLLADTAGRVVGAAHAGWRGLAAGVLENTVAAMRERLPASAVLQAWLGPAIGPAAFEVGDEVRDAFCRVDAGHRPAFLPAGRPGKWHADLYQLARRRLAGVGVQRVDGGGWCTWGDRTRFWSYRRRREGGRMASVVWIAG